MTERPISVRPLGPGPHIIKVARGLPNVHCTDDYPLREDIRRAIMLNALAALRRWRQGL
jgi:hypothetical protein